MRIGHAGTIDELDSDASTRFADDAGITLRFLRRRVTMLTTAIQRAYVELRVPDELRQRTTLSAAALCQQLAFSIFKTQE